MHAGCMFMYSMLVKIYERMTHLHYNMNVSKVWENFQNLSSGTALVHII